MIQKMRKEFYVLGFVSLSSYVYAVDPLSKIVITSDQATCTKCPDQEGHFVFTYQNNVQAQFSDGTKVTADNLEIIFDSKKKTSPIVDQINKKPQTLQNFKRIAFNNNVCVTNKHRNARANKAQLFLEDQRCLLDGNVRISQNKQNPKDVPVQTTSTSAEFNLKTGTLQLHGNPSQPVSTTIVLEGHPALLTKKERIEKKKLRTHKRLHESKNQNSTTQRSS